MKNFGSLFAAYAAAWLIFFAFEVSVSSRLTKLQKELEELRKQLSGK